MRQILFKGDFFIQQLNDHKSDDKKSTHDKTATTESLDWWEQVCLSLWKMTFEPDTECQSIRLSWVRPLQRQSIRDLPSYLLRSGLRNPF